MKLRDKKQAYTLAEIMLVILVLSIIFAAFAPIFTKRKITQYTGKYNVWSYLDRINFDAFYDPGDPSFTGQLFFGVTPGDARSVKSELAPLSKIVVRAGEVTSSKTLQRHIQFRYGRTESDKDGTYAGSWLVTRRNMLLGGTYSALAIDEATGAKDNVAIGYDSVNQLTTGKDNVAIGYRALSKISGTGKNVAVGYLAGSENNGEKNVFIGYNAGKKSKANTTIAVGYQAGYGASTNNQNIFIGAYAGGGLASETSNAGEGNTAIGYGALGKLTTGTRNIAIGYNALQKLTTGAHNIAIGYNACSELTTESNKTCIGYNSGPKKKNDNSKRQSGGYNAQNNGSAFLLWNNNGTGDAKGDTIERVYIGGSPRNYAGDAILELHNPESSNEYMSTTNDSNFGSNATTVINGNLIVRGRPYFTVGKKLIHFHNSFEPNLLVPLKPFGYKDGSSSSSPYVQCVGTDVTSGLSYAWDKKCPQFKTKNTSVPVTPPPPPPPPDPPTPPFDDGCQDLCQECKYLQSEAQSNPHDMWLAKDANDVCNYYNVTCSEPCRYSDRRLKNIGERFNGGLKDLKALNVYNFTFKNDKNKLPQVGVIAQELRKVFPNAVFQDNNGYLKIRWDEMFYATINAIKELDKKIVALAKRTIKVETQITQLEKENVELKSQVESLTARVNKLKAQ